MSSLRVEDVFFIKDRGIVVAGNINQNISPELKVGTLVKIERPDGTCIFSTIQGVDFFRSSCFSEERQNVGVLLEGLINTEDAPRDSVITVIESK